MNNEETKQLCLSLLHCDSEDEVIQILKIKNMWDDKRYWRYYGDDEGNSSTIQGQQSRSDASLAEKIINSIDARLMNECLVRGIDPSSEQAPQSIREAVAEYFEGRRSDSLGGGIQKWDNKKLREEAANITVATTGSKNASCITIADLGEGQTPDQLPNTILSLRVRNKIKIMFVQGQYNQGGSGALCFCGQHGIQLVISKRNPRIFNSTNSSSFNNWGFTIVRRVRPSEQGPNVKLSIYTYLAPNIKDMNDSKGNVLEFHADSLELMPQGKEPYTRIMSWGTAIKLYNYDMKGFRSSAILPDGLRSRIEALRDTVKTAGISFPEIHEIHRDNWEQYSFDDSSACAVIKENTGAYTFYINIDNKYLVNEMKYHKSANPKLLKNKFVYGNVLLGLALLYDQEKRKESRDKKDDNDDEPTPEEKVSNITRAISPFLLGMIEGLGSISDDDSIPLNLANDDS